MRFWIAIAGAALFVLAWTRANSLQPQRETGVLPIEPPTPYIHFSPAGLPRGRVLVGHGLDACKETMQILSAALADAGFDVYAIDLPGHGSSTAPFEASYAQRAILNAYEHLGGSSTIVMGHSLSAGLVLDLAVERHFGTLVLFSPPPTPVDRIQADRVLLIAGELEPPRVSGFGATAADAGGPQVEFRKLKWAGHSTAIFHPIHIRNVVEWIGGDTRNLKTISRFFWIGLMFAAAMSAGVALMPPGKLDPVNTPIPAVLVRYVAAFSAALLILKVFVPLAFIRLFAMDYLISFLLLTGLGLWIQQRPRLEVNPRALLKGLAAAVFVIVVIGFGPASNFLHLSLSNERWWRFPIIFASGIFLFIFDEVAIRRISPRWKSIAVALITRVLLWAFIVIGVLLLNRENAFLVLVAHLMVLFWLFLWFTAEIVHRHTRDPFASALYAALVQGWAFAAWFVTI